MAFARSSMRTDADDLESELVRYVEKLESLGAIDLFFLGLGPEAGAASHLAYIKPRSGASYTDLAGLIPISESILDLSAGGVIDGTETIDEVGQRVFEHIIAVAGGVEAKAETHKHREFQFWAEQTVSL